MNAFGLFAAAGMLLVVVWLRLRHRELGVSENEFWAAVWTIVLGGIIGAKALFVVLGREHYASGELRLWRDFGTGFVFMGGLAGAIAAGALFARLRRVDFWRGADHFAMALPFGHALGRVGCQVQGCCAGVPPHPVPLYEATGLVAIAVFCGWRLRTRDRGNGASGEVFCTYLALYALLRLVLDPLRADGRPERFLGLSHQQGLALLVLAGAVAAAWWRRARRDRAQRGTSLSAQS